MKMKDTSVRVKAGPDDGLKEGQFEAYASVFGNKDSYGDVVVPGAFADTLEQWKSGDALLPLLFGHNMSDPDFNLGYVEDAKEDDHGLLTKNQLDLDNPKSVQVYRLIKGRRINQMSFAYDVLEGGYATRQKDPKGDDGPDNQEEYFELRKLKLYEVSVVPIGANQETEITAFKAAELAERMLHDGRLDQKSFDSFLKSYLRMGDALTEYVKRNNAVLLGNANGASPAPAVEEPPAKTDAPVVKPSADSKKLAALINLQILEGEI
jgi:HK97 family phage prohead protease